MNIDYAIQVDVPSTLHQTHFQADYSMLACHTMEDTGRGVSLRAVSYGRDIHMGVRTFDSCEPQEQELICLFLLFSGNYF